MVRGRRERNITSQIGREKVRGGRRERSITRQIGREKFKGREGICAVGLIAQGSLYLRQHLRAAGSSQRRVLATSPPSSWRNKGLRPWGPQWGTASGTVCFDSRG